MHDLGGGGGSTVVLSHGTGLHGLVWAPLAAHLRQEFRCYSFDARGHGSSDAPADGDFAWTALAGDILALLGGLGLDRPYGVGHSSGATALLLAEQMRPGTFAGLYCFEPVVVAADPPLGRDPDSWMAVQARRRRRSFGSRDEAFAHYSSKPPFATVDPEVLRAYVDHGFEDGADGTVRLKCRPETEALVQEMATAHDCFARLGEVRCPVMVAWGERTDPFVQQTLKAVAAALPLGLTQEVPGAGHFGPLEVPEAVAGCIRSFLLEGPPALPPRAQRLSSGGPEAAPPSSVPGAPS